MQYEEIMTILMRDNFLAAKRAAASAVVTLEGKESIGNEWGLGVRIEMQTSRGTPTIPRGPAHWVVSGDKVVAHSKAALEFFLVAFGASWDAFFQRYKRPPIGQTVRIPLKEVFTVCAAANG